MDFFTADTHFFHPGIVHNARFADRHFLTIGGMNEQIVNSWNATVALTDQVYHLGDIALISTKAAELARLLSLLLRLNGNICFIKGNHDNQTLFKYLAKHNITVNGKPKFTFHEVGIRLKFAKYQFFLTHYPMIVGPAKNRINLHGHIHNRAVNMAENINVGVDSPEKDYLHRSIPFGTPFSRDDIVMMVTEKKIDYQKRR